MKVMPSIDEEVRSVVLALDAIDGVDGEGAHSRADQILLDAVNPAIREAYKRLQDRCGWWACA